MKTDKTILQFAATLFLISLVFPVAASLVPEARIPAWAGSLDVVVAFGVMDAAIRVHMLYSATDAAGHVVVAHRASQAVMTGVLALLVFFLTMGDRVRWNVLLP